MQEYKDRIRKLAQIYYDRLMQCGPDAEMLEKLDQIRDELDLAPCKAPSHTDTSLDGDMETSWDYSNYAIEQIEDTRHTNPFTNQQAHQMFDSLTSLRKSFKRLLSGISITKD